MKMASRLRNLYKSFCPKWKELIPKGDLPYMLKHYRNLCFCPLPLKDLSILHWLLLLTLFLITRAVVYSHIAYYIFFRFRELSAEFPEHQSNMRALAYIDVLMWLLMYGCCIPADLLLLNKSFHKAARVLFYRITMETKNIPNLKSGRRSIAMLPFHEIFVHVSVIYMAVSSFWPGMDEFTQIYARVPTQFHNPLNRAINWLFVALTAITANMCIAFILVFPACLAFWIGEVMEIIAEDALSGMRGNPATSNDIRKMIQRYTNLYMAVREVNNFIKFPTFMLHGIVTIQQMAETYTTLTLREYGMDSGISLFIDLMVTFLRVASGFYALTYLTKGMEKFEETIRICMLHLGKLSMKTVGSSKDLKEIRQRIRCINAIKLKIGPYALEKDIALQGSFFYVNNYATAALWPRD